jgi:hypothetical protein
MTDFACSGSSGLKTEGAHFSIRTLTSIPCSGLGFPVEWKPFPALSENFPVSLSREFHRKLLQFNAAYA